MKKIYTLFVVAACGINAFAQSTLSASSGKILVYFNQPVDNSVATFANAVYLNQTMIDTLNAYINRAKQTIDIAQYEYATGSYSTVTIATAINNAYSRGVKIDRK